MSRIQRILIGLLLWLPLSGCLSRSGPAMPLLQEKGERSREKARALLQACQMRPALEETLQTFHFAQLRDDRETMAEALLDLANLHMALGEHTLAEAFFRKAEGRFRRQGNLRALFEVETGQAMLLVRRGLFQAARERFERLLADPPRFAGAEDPAWRIPLHHGLAMASRGEGLHALALEHLDQAEHLARQAEARREMASIQMNRARVLFDQQNWSAARKSAGQALDLDREMENVSGIAADLAMLAAIAEREGALDEAREGYHQAGDLFDHCGLTTQSEASHAKARALTERSGGDTVRMKSQNSR